MSLANIDSCRLMQLPKNQSNAGSISVFENSTILPFDVERVFYIYDIPGGVDRGAHAHKECHQFLIAASGSFEVEIDDGKNKTTVRLSHPDLGLHIPPGIWAAEKDFSSGAICLVMTSLKYDEADYLRDYNSYLKYLVENENR
jgi:hypothetical protein